MLALHENALLTALREHRDVQRLVRTIDTLPRLIGEKLLNKYQTDAPALYIVPGQFTVKDDQATMKFTVAGVVRNVAGHAQARKGDGIDLGCDHLMTLATRALNRQVLGDCSWSLVSGEMADDEVFDIAGISAIELQFVSSPVILDADYGEEQLAELGDYTHIVAEVPDQPEGFGEYTLWVHEDGPPVPPRCDSFISVNERFWIPLTVGFGAGQPIWTPDRPARLDLAARNIVTSGNSHSDGQWYFEFALEKIYIYSGDPALRDTDTEQDISEENLWLYGGLVSCTNLSESPDTPRLIFADNGTTALNVSSTFGDNTTVTGLDALPFGNVRLGMWVDCDTGDWQFYAMNGDMLASGQSPDIVGAPMLAAVGSITATAGYFHVQGLYLRDTEFEIADIPNNAPAWQAEPT